MSVDSKRECWEMKGGNKFCAGGHEENQYGNKLDSILQFDGESQQWEEVGQLKQKRGYHATSVINITEIDTYLNCD